MIINKLQTYSPIINIEEIIEIYVAVDDFCIDFRPQLEPIMLSEGLFNGKKRKSKLSDSEMMTILICFHRSGYRNFKSFYNNHVRMYWLDLFPDLISYERFNQSQQKVLLFLMAFLKNRCMGKCRGINFVDSTRLQVCHIKREKQHKVFKGIATKGKDTMGWFFGFKLHLVINDKGDVLSFYLSKANVDDRNLKVFNVLVKNVFGKLCGDRGYISKTLADYLWNDGVHLVYKRRKNMKKQNLSDTDKILLRKRALIESVNDELKNICNIQHTRHRSTKGFLINLVSGLAAYHFLPKKPSLNIKPFHENQQLLLSAA